MLPIKVRMQRPPRAPWRRVSAHRMQTAIEGKNALTHSVRPRPLRVAVRTTVTAEGLRAAMRRESACDLQLAVWAMNARPTRTVEEVKSVSMGRARERVRIDVDRTKSAETANGASTGNVSGIEHNLDWPWSERVRMVAVFGRSSIICGWC